MANVKSPKSKTNISFYLSRKASSDIKYPKSKNQWASNREVCGTLLGKELALWMKWEKMVRQCVMTFQLFHMKLCFYLF